jgi:galactose mutarotase-like enzyme
MSKRHPRTLEIAAEGAHALVYPEHGFQLHAFEVEVAGRGRQPLIFGPPERGEPFDRRYGNPILFPNIGYAHGALSHHWDHDGQHLLMPLHGWARDLYWHVEDVTPSSVSAWLEPTHGIELAFPFAFKLRCRYSIERSALVLDAEVHNTGDRKFPYALGFHPYLLAPLTPAGTREGTYVSVPSGTRLETADAWRSISRSSHAARRVKTAEPELYRAIVLEDTGATALEVVDENSRLAACVSVEDSPQSMPVWGIWSGAPDAEYLCLEPWTDEPNSLRNARRSLNPGEQHRYRMSISLRQL